MNLSLDQSEGSVLSDDFLETPDDLDINVDDIETPDETDSLEFLNNGNELEWEGQTKGRLRPQNEELILLHHELRLLKTKGENEGRLKLNYNNKH